MKQHFAGLLGILLICSFSLMTAQEPTLKVTEAKLGKNVENRVLVNEDSVFAVNERAYLWIRVTGGPSDSITVTWSMDTLSYPTKLNIGGSPWRTWSYKTLAVAGTWTVTVSDAAGNVLKEMSFKAEEMKKE